MALVLIVDDDATIRSSAQQTLAVAGFETITAQHGFDALRLLQRVQPACVLLDLNMPVLDGYGFLQIVRKRGELLPVLLMTADPDGLQLGQAEGVLGHIPRPFNPDDLVRAVMGVTQADASPMHPARHHAPDAVAQGEQWIGVEQQVGAAPTDRMLT